MIKQQAKRNNRQRKKLKVDEWRQWSFSVAFNYTSTMTALELDEAHIDSLYDIADRYGCWMMGFMRSGEATFTFHNKHLLEHGIDCQVSMAEYLEGLEDVSNIRVGFREEDYEHYTAQATNTI